MLACAVGEFIKCRMSDDGVADAHQVARARNEASVSFRTADVFQHPSIDYSPDIYFFSGLSLSMYKGDMDIDWYHSLSLDMNSVPLSPVA